MAEQERWQRRGKRVGLGVTETGFASFLPHLGENEPVCHLASMGQFNGTTKESRVLGFVLSAQ
jgi:hypothetical protein